MAKYIKNLTKINLFVFKYLVSKIHFSYCILKVFFIRRNIHNILIHTSSMKIVV